MSATHKKLANDVKQFMRDASEEEVGEILAVFYGRRVAQWRSKIDQVCLEANTTVEAALQISTHYDELRTQFEQRTQSVIDQRNMAVGELERVQEELRVLRQWVDRQCSYQSWYQARGG